MEAKIKINELEQANQLSSTHLIIVQDGAVENAETKKATLSLLRTWLGSLNFEDLTKFLVAGEDISIDVDETEKIIKINSTSVASKWYAGDQPSEANEGDFWLNETGEVYRYDGVEWAAAAINLTGPKGSDGVNGLNGKDGFNPIVTVVPSSNGYSVTFKDATQEQTIDIINGLVPYINEETLTWVIGDVDTGISALGISPTARVEETENGYAVIVNDEVESRVDINTPTIEFGTVEMLPAGQEPVIENVGNNVNAILNLKIPKGVDGGGSVVVQGPYTIFADSWSDDRRQFVSIPLELTNRNVIDIDYEELPIWSSYQVRPIKEDETGIIFKYTVKPITDLTFYITSMGVNS